MADIIAGVFSLLAIVALIAGFVGLVKPSLIKQDSKGKAFGKCMVAYLAFSVVVIIAIPKDENPKQEVVETVSKEPLINRQAEKANKAVDISTIRQKADNGDTTAQFNLGIAYYTGEGINQDKKEAFKWFQKSAHQGHATAQANIGAMYLNGEGVEANQEKAIEALKKAAELGSKDAQTALDKITKLYDDDRWAVINVLSIVYSETNSIEQRYSSFLKTVENNNITQAIRDAQSNRKFLLRLDKSKYNNKDKVKDTEAKKMLDDLVEAHNNANTQLWAYFDEFLDYVDEKKPSQLVEMENNLKFYQNRKLAVIAQFVGLSSKYKIGFDDEKGHWRTNEDIEADKTKREKEQKESKKNKPFINTNKYNKKSAQYALAKFITAWQYRDFKEMAKYTQTSWREREISPHGDLANSYDFKFLTSAKLGKAKCNGSLCNIPATITYKNDINGKTETHTIKPNVIRESGKWGVNPISAIREH